MTREDLKAHCEKQVEACEMWVKWKGMEPGNNSRYEEHKLILDLLEQTEWIPCSVRLPEEYGNYLTTVESSDGTATITYQYVDHYGPGWLHEDKMHKVIAWMPLPKPYKAESEVEE